MKTKHKLSFSTFSILKDFLPLFGIWQGFFSVADEKFLL